MVDCKAYLKMVPMATTQIVLQPHRTLILDEVPLEKLHLCTPTVFGYSFGSKKWGRLRADSFRDINWRRDAFDHLVLSEQKKRLVRSVVLADSSKIISDVVSAKAGGFIVILHGKPGTGKTLTAEAIAENAQKPLIVLSAVELGGGAVEMERNLRNILDLCKMWDALLLIDEAEVYLEARSLGNIERNAMVSAFLRVLEYHQQIIFLTTNHVARLDTAFKSRVSLAIKYPDLDKSARKEIWRRLLKMATVNVGESECQFVVNGSLTNTELEHLSERKMNGRFVFLSWTG